MFSLFNRFTLDSIGEVGFGRNLGSLENADNPVLKSFDAAQVYAMQRIIVRCISWRLERFLGSTAEREMQRHCKALDEYARDIARKAWQAHVASPGIATMESRGTTGSSSRRSARGHQGDFLSLFIQEMRQAGASGSGDVLSTADEDYLRDLVMNFLIAGRDTTAQALSWTFLLLAQHPTVEAKLVAELQGQLGDGTELDFDSVSRLEYAQCVIDEALRLFPSVPKNIKVAISDDVLPDGTIVPAGCNICHVPYMMGRMTSIWGADAGTFRPERWLGKEATDLYAYPVFHAGPRECLGRRMAYLEMKVALAVLLPRFKFHLTVDPSEICYSDALTMPMSSTLPMKAERRV